MTNRDDLFELAIDFLENGGELPGTLTAAQRFHVLAAMQRHMSGKVTDTKHLAEETRDCLKGHLQAHDRDVWLRNRVAKWVGGAVGGTVTLLGILKTAGII